MRILLARLRAFLVVCVLLACGCGTPLPSTPEGDSSRPAIATELQRALDRAITSGGSIGGSATIRSGNNVDEYVSGRGALEPEAPFPKRARFRIGSITKIFVAAVVLQLVDEGKVQLDAPLRRYLPQLPGNSTVDPSRITVREALHHQSGFPEYLNEPELLQAMQPGPPAFSPDQLIQLALRHPAQFSPGTQIAYVNTNYIVAGMIVEAVTRRSFSNEVHDRIAAPLGLRDTTFPPPQESDIAGVHGRGYELVDGRSKVIDDVEPSATWTAGAMISTGADLTTFIAALARGRVIPLRLMLEQNSMTSSHELPVPGTRYGLGLMEFHLRCGITVRGHVGDIPGFHSVAAATLNGQHSASIVLTQEPTGAGTATWPIQMLEAALCAG